MGSFFTLIVFALVAAGFVFYARKLQQGGFTQEELEALRKRVITAVILLIAVGLLAASIVNVPVGNKLVLYNKFSRQYARSLDPGYSLVLPGLYEKYTYDTRSQVYTMSGVMQEGDVQRADAIEVLSADGLKMDLDITIQFKLDSERITDLHTNIGPDYIAKIIRPSSREAIRNEFAKHEATEAYSSKRDEIELKLVELIAVSFSKYYITLEEVQVRNIVLPPTVVTAIEMKKAAQQEAEQMEYILEKEQKEKERVQIEAEAQAERIRIVNEALANNPNYLHWLAIDKLNDQIELVITDGKTILNLDAIKSD